MKIIKLELNAPVTFTGENGEMVNNSTIGGSRVDMHFDPSQNVVEIDTPGPNRMFIPLSSVKVIICEDSKKEVKTPDEPKAEQKHQAKRK